MTGLAPATRILCGGAIYFTTVAGAVLERVGAALNTTIGAANLISVAVPVCYLYSRD